MVFGFDPFLAFPLPPFVSPAAFPSRQDTLCSLLGTKLRSILISDSHPARFYIDSLSWPGLMPPWTGRLNAACLHTRTCGPWGTSLRTPSPIASCGQARYALALMAVETPLPAQPILDFPDPYTGAAPPCPVFRIVARIRLPPAARGPRREIGKIHQNTNLPTYLYLKTYIILLKHIGIEGMIGMRAQFRNLRPSHGAAFGWGKSLQVFAKAEMDLPIPWKCGEKHQCAIQ